MPPVFPGLICGTCSAWSRPTTSQREDWAVGSFHPARWKRWIVSLSSFSYFFIFLGGGLPLRFCNFQGKITNKQKKQLGWGCVWCLFSKGHFSTLRFWEGDHPCHNFGMIRSELHHWKTSILKPRLVAGFNPIETYDRQIWSFPQGSGWKSKNVLKPPPTFFGSSHLVSA